LDNLNAASDPRLKQWWLAHQQSLAHFRFEQFASMDPAAVERLFEHEAKTSIGRDTGPPFAAGLDLAARTDVRPSVADRWAYFEANATGTLNLPELSAAA
jgi:hypothetical protein